jgi:hypothetical protein
MIVSGVNRAIFGERFASSSRYLHIMAALLIPAIALAADAIARRQRLLLPVMLALFVVGVPANLGETLKSFPPEQYFAQYEEMVRALPRHELALEVPKDLHPELVNGPRMTIGWLLDAASAGQIPSPDGSSTPQQLATYRLRLSLQQLDDGVAGQCTPVQAPVVKRMAKGDEVVVRGALQVQLVDDDTGVMSTPVLLGASLLAGGGDHTLRAVNGPITLRFVRNALVGSLCTVAAEAPT